MDRLQLQFYFFLLYWLDAFQAAQWSTESPSSTGASTIAIAAAYTLVSFPFITASSITNVAVILTGSAQTISAAASFTYFVVIGYLGGMWLRSAGPSPAILTYFARLFATATTSLLSTPAAVSEA